MTDYNVSLEHMRNLLRTSTFDKTGVKRSKVLQFYEPPDRTSDKTEPEPGDKKEPEPGDKKEPEPGDKKEPLRLFDKSDVLNMITQYTPSNNVMLQMTSKKVKEKMEKTTPIRFRLSRSFMKFENDEVGLSNVLTQLDKQSRSFNIVTIEMPGCQLTRLPNDGTDRIAEVLGHCPNLEYLNLSYTGIRNWNAIGEALSKCKNLKRVNFAKSILSNELFYGLQHCQELQDLDIHNSLHFHHCHDGLADLMKTCNTSLLKLNLSGCDFNGVGIGNTFNLITDALPFCVNLKHLDLSNNGLPDDLMQLLQGAFSRCLQLENLNLSDNDFSTVVCRRMASWLGNSRALKYLNLKGNNIRTHALDAYIRLGVFNSLICLNLSSCHIDNMIDVSVFGEELSKCTHLTQLILSNNRLGDNFTEELVTALPRCTSLTSLDLMGIRASDWGVQGLVDVIPKCTCLTRLNITDNMISTETKAEIKNSWIQTHGDDHCGLWMDVE